MRQSIDAYYRRLLQRYTVTIEGPDLAKAARSPAADAR
jgi:hypothetical protein